jgi:hypothetical protein
MHVAVGELAVEAEAVEAKALGGVVAATEFDDIGAEFAEKTPLFGAVFGREIASGEGIAGGEPEGEEVGEGRGARMEWCQVAVGPRFQGRRGLAMQAGGSASRLCFEAVISFSRLPKQSGQYPPLTCRGRRKP